MMTRRDFMRAAGVAAVSATFPFFDPAARLTWYGSAAAQEPAGRPNVLVIVLDDMRPDSLPAMSRLMARPYGNWSQFTGMRANCALCAPSRATLLTGGHVADHGVKTNRVGLREFNGRDTLYSRAAAAGYAVGHIGKVLHAAYKPSRWPGASYWQTSNPGISGQFTQAREFIEGAASSWLLMLNLFAPHRGAFQVPAEYRDAQPYIPPDAPDFDRIPAGGPAFWGKMTLTAGEIKDIRAERLKEQRGLMAVDAEIGALLDWLHGSGRLTDTWVFVVGDNGYSFGGRRFYYKAAPHAHETPLFVRPPRSVGATVIGRPVGMADVAATIFEIVGARPVYERGVSLLPMLAGGDEPPIAGAWPVYLEGCRPSGGVPPYRGVVATVDGRRWQLVHYPSLNDGELYDLDNDRAMLSNLYRNDDYAAVRQALMSETVRAGE